MVALRRFEPAFCAVKSRYPFKSNSPKLVRLLQLDIQFNIAMH